MSAVGSIVAGMSAVGTLPLFWPVILVLLAGLGASQRRSLGEHLLSAAMIAVLFAGALSQRGVGGMDEMSRWLAVGLLIFAADLGRRHQGSLHASTVVWALILGSAAVLLRGDVYGPSLGTIRGSWQASPERAALFLYHFGSGAGLAGLYLISVGVGRRLGEFARTWPPAAGALVLIALLATGWIHRFQEFLLLHWPPQRWG